MSITSIVKDVAPLGGVTTMEHVGFKAKIMRAQRLVGDHVHSLPPGETITVFPIATLPGSPESWVREAGIYVVPVETEIGIWFDWRTNDLQKDWNIAVIPSVKGMNPITGMKLDGFGLHNYQNNCPIHDEPFAHGRVCEKCGYEWPAQNYVTKDGELWWDGFRQPDGSVRQFFFTDEDKRDVASAVIGKRNTVPAFGFAFYKTKVNRESPRPQIATVNYYWEKYIDQPQSYVSFAQHNIADDAVSVMDDFSSDVKLQSISASATFNSSFDRTRTNIASRSPIIKKKATQPKKSKSVSVGAGAKINQKLEPDSLGLDGWNEEHSGVIRLYFCFEQEFKEIIQKGGVKELKSNPEGYLKDLPVG